MPKLSDHINTSKIADKNIPQSEKAIRCSYSLLLGVCFVLCGFARLWGSVLCATVSRCHHGSVSLAQGLCALC